MYNYLLWDYQINYAYFTTQIFLINNTCYA
jgi:hypothetical protein